MKDVNRRGVADLKKIDFKGLEGKKQERAQDTTWKKNNPKFFLGETGKINTTQYPVWGLKLNNVAVI